MKIDGVIVLYNPDEEVIRNINSYINSIEMLYIVDNSENTNTKLINTIKNISTKCKYIENNGNKGIAYALNVGAKMSINDGADWLLTMDQDSFFDQNELNNYIENIKNFKYKKSVAVFAPNYLKQDNSINIKDNNLYIEATTVITSGSLINLSLFNIVGQFDENLFIDEVDHDYCLRAITNSYKVIMFKNIGLKHQLGDAKLIKFFNIKKSIISHSPIRHYYAARNVLYIRKKHKNDFRLWTKNRVIFVTKKILKTLLFDDDKLKRIIFIFRGIKDFYLNNMWKIK